MSQMTLSPSISELSPDAFARPSHADRCPMTCIAAPACSTTRQDHGCMHASSGRSRLLLIPACNKWPGKAGLKGSVSCSVRCPCRLAEPPPKVEATRNQQATPVAQQHEAFRYGNTSVRGSRREIGPDLVMQPCPERQMHRLPGRMGSQMFCLLRRQQMHWLDTAARARSPAIFASAVSCSRLQPAGCAADAAQPVGYLTQSSVSCRPPTTGRHDVEQEGWVE